MENFKQIVYRNEDQVLVILPENEIIETKVVFLEALETDLKIKLDSLKNLCISKIEYPLKYVVAEKGTNIINVEYENGVLQLNILDLSNAEKLAVQNAIDVCTQLIN